MTTLYTDPETKSEIVQYIPHDGIVRTKFRKQIGKNGLLFNLSIDHIPDDSLVPFCKTLGQQLENIEKELKKEAITEMQENFKKLFDIK